MSPAPLDPRSPLLQGCVGGRQRFGDRLIRLLQVVLVTGESRRMCKILTWVV